MQEVNDTAINKLLGKAKIALMGMPNSAFFSTILLSLKFVWDDSQPTAWVDGLKMGYNRKFFQVCSPEERIGVLVHECCHVAYMHLLRGAGKDHEIMNDAADHVINLDLEARGFKLPSFRLADPRFAGMSTEQVYTVLLAEKQQGMPQLPNGMPDLRQPGDEEDGKGKPTGQTKDGDGVMTEAELKRVIDDIIIRAQVHSKMANDAPGAIPGEVEVYLDQLLDPKLPWQTILRKWLKSLGKFDYSWKRPNRRFMPDHYLPSLWSEGAMVDFQAWMDVSGSETDYDNLVFVSELNGILKMMKPKKIELGQFDTRIKSITTVRNIMDLANVKFTGRGGTRITEVLDHIEKTKPKVAMIFSDGGFRMDRDTCNTNILWMIHDNPNWTAPFGKVIHYDNYNG